MQGTLSSAPPSSSLSSSVAKTCYAPSVRVVSRPPRSTGNVEAKRRTATRVSTPVYGTGSTATSLSTRVFTAATALPRPPSSSTWSLSSRVFRRFPVVAASALWTPATVDVLQPPQRRHHRRAASAATQPSPQRRCSQQPRPRRRSKVSASRTSAPSSSSNAAARNSVVVTTDHRPVVVALNQVRSMSQPRNQHQHHQQLQQPQQQQQLPPQHPRHHHLHPFHQLQRGNADDHGGNDCLVTSVFAGSTAARFMYPRYVPAVLPPQFPQPMSNPSAYRHVSTPSSSSSSLSPPPLSHPWLGFRYSTTATNGNLGTTTWIVATSASTISKPVVSLTVADSRFRAAAAVRVLPSDATVFAVHGVVAPSSASVIPLVPGRACSSVSAGGSAFRRPSQPPEPTALVLPSGDNRNPCLVALPQPPQPLQPVPLLPSAASSATAKRRSNGRRGPYRVPTDRCYVANAVVSLAARAPVRGNDSSKSAITTVAARNNDRTAVRLPSPPTISTPMEQQHLMFHHHYHHFYGVNGQKRLSSSSASASSTTTTASLMQQQSATKRDHPTTPPSSFASKSATATFCRSSGPVSRSTVLGTIATAVTTTPRIAACVASCRDIGGGLLQPAATVTTTANTVKRDRVVPAATTGNAASNVCSLTTASTTSRASSRRSPQHRRTAVAADCGGIRTYIDGLSFRLDVRLLAVERRLNTLSSLNKRLSRLLEHPLFASSSSPLSRVRVPSEPVLRNATSASRDTADDRQRVREFPLDCSLMPVTAPGDTSLSAAAATTTATTTSKTAAAATVLPRRRRSLAMDRTSLGEVATRAADTDANNNCRSSSSSHISSSSSSSRLDRNVVRCAENGRSDDADDSGANDTKMEEASSLRDVHANAVQRCEASMQTESVVPLSLNDPSRDTRDDVACCFESNRDAGYRSCNHDDGDDDENNNDDDDAEDDEEDDDTVVDCAGQEVGYDEDDNDVEAVETLETRYFRRHAVRTAGDGEDGDDPAERLANGQSLPS